MKTISLYQFALAKKIPYKDCVIQYQSGELKNTKLIRKRPAIDIDDDFPNYENIREFKSKEATQCLICKNKHIGRGDTCSKECRNIKRKATNLDKFGTENPFASPEISKKIRENSLKKYGVSFPSNSVEAKEKRKKTCVEKYGTEFAISSKEVIEKSKSTLLKKYGVENSFQSPEVLRKIKKTCLDRYGTEHFFQSNDIKEKIKITNIERYGVDNPAKSSLSKIKSKETCLNKYGVEHHSQSIGIKEKISATNNIKYGTSCSLNNPDVKKKSEKTLFEKYGVNNPFKSNTIRLKCSETMIKKYGVKSSFQIDWVRFKAVSLVSREKRRFTLKLKGNSKTSKQEDKLFEVLCNLFGSNVERQVGVKSWEIDFYIPSIFTYINFNGVYWHGRYSSIKELENSPNPQAKKIIETKYRDSKRECFFKNEGINFTVIWEDDFKKDPINSVFDSLSHSGIMRWRKAGIYEIPDLHPGKLYQILLRAFQQ